MKIAFFKYILIRDILIYVIILSVVKKKKRGIPRSDYCPFNIAMHKITTDIMDFMVKRLPWKNPLFQHKIE